MATNPSPLCEGDCDHLDTLLQSCSDTKELLARLKRCGLAVEELENETDGQAELAKKIKAEFFPDRV